MARISNTVLNRSGKSEHPYLVSHLIFFFCFSSYKSKFQFFLIEYDISYGFVTYDLYYVELYSF